MTSKHTPGPWLVKGKQSIRGSDGEYIAKTNWNNGAANARLIAAAPELLSALQVAELALRERGLRACGEYKQIEAAIAKATGAD